MSSWLAKSQLTSTERSNNTELFPVIVTNTDAWLHPSRIGGKRTLIESNCAKIEVDLEKKMGALALRPDMSKPARDIESTDLVRF